MALNEDQYLSLKVGIFNAIGFCLAVIVTTYVDPMLQSHVK
jgi:hypothetical protein